MKVGDLVRYSGREALNWIGNGTEVGIVVNVHNNSVITVLWNNGVESCHSIARLRWIKEIA